MKFSDIYIETKIIKIQRDEQEIVYEERNIIKELIPRNKELYYVWGNIGYALLYYNNSNIMKLKDLCFDIERKIKHGDFDIVILDIKNVLLPFLDKLTIEEINIIKKAYREAVGPLYDCQPNYQRLTTPQIFIDFLN